jgi:hypothetical protein
VVSGIVIGPTAAVPTSAPTPAPVATTQVQISTCTGPSRIIQNCAFGGAADVNLETQAINSVMQAHQLPANDKARLSGWARDELRAVIYANLVNAFAKPTAQRTADEQAAIKTLIAAVRENHVLAATVAQQHYTKWAAYPCSYVPPGGFTFDQGTSCATGVGTVYSTPEPPPLSAFQAYGASAAYPSDSAYATVAGATARSMGAVYGLAIAAAAGTITGVTGANIAVGSTVLYALVPNLAQVIATSGGSVSVVAGGPDSRRPSPRRPPRPLAGPAPWRSPVRPSSSCWRLWPR